VTTKVTEESITTHVIVRNAAILRGIAAILIIGKHTLGRALLTSDPLLQPLYVVLTSLTSCAVPIFLVLSGFSLSLGAGNKIRFGKYGNVVLKKLWPAYTIWYLLYRVMWGIKHSADLSLPNVVKQYLLLSDNWHLWFLVLIGQLYLLFPLLHRFYRSAVVGKSLALLLLPVVHFGGNFIETLDSQPFVPLYLGRLFSYSTLYFVLGFYLKDYGATLIECAKKPVFILSCIVVAGTITTTSVLVIGPQFWPDYLSKPLGLVGLFSVFDNTAKFVLLFALCDSVLAHGGWLKDYLSAYGLYSYGIYLAHVVPMSLSYSVLRLVVHSDSDIVILGNMLATIVLSKILVRWLAKAPLSHYYT